MSRDANHQNTGASLVGTRLVAFDLRGANRPSPDAGALAVVGGLPILVRTLLVLARGGVRRVLLVVDPADRQRVASVVDRHSRLSLDIEWAEDAGATLGPVARAASSSRADVLYWPGRATFGLALPGIISAGVADDGVAVDGATNGQTASGLVLIGSRALEAAENLSAPALVKRCGGSPRFDETAPTAPVLIVASTADVAVAEARLLQSLRKGLDGVFATYDRRVSLWMSSRLMKYPVRPNHVTAVAGAIGLMSGALAARGGYIWLLAGAVSYLVSNIVDGVDGEIARAKLLESRVGEWLDTVVDDAGSLVFIVGTAIGCARTWQSDFYYVLAGVCAFSLLAGTAIMYHHLLTIAHSGDLLAIELPWKQHRTTGPMSRFLGLVRPLTRRDAVCYMALGWALIGQARVMVWLAAIGATGAWLTLLAYKTVVPAMRRGQ